MCCKAKEKIVHYSSVKIDFSIALKYEQEYFCALIAKMTLLEELKERGLLQDHTPGIEEILAKEQVKGYIGYDPTAPSLTIGNLVTIMMLVHLQRHGHIPVVLFGGATGRVGDPSGKDAERKMLDIETIERNLEHQKKQFEHILRFDQGDNKAIMVNNYDWFKDISFLDFLREAGKHLTVNYMMSKESVKRRIETGISFTEFSYQLLQGYDYYHLYQTEGIKLQMGGSDQWGNITTGTEFIRRKAGGEAFAITCPLLTKSDGTKYGKSEGQNIWLYPKMTSPYKFYQFFMNKIKDEDLPKVLKIFSVRPLEEIREIISDCADNPLQLRKTLAEEVTLFVHGEEGLAKAQELSGILFSKGKGAEEILAGMTLEEIQEVFEGEKTVYNLDKQLFENGIDVLDLLASATPVCSSKSEARRSIKGNAISINKQKITNPEAIIDKSSVINDQFILLQNGKRNHHLIIVE